MKKSLVMLFMLLCCVSVTFAGLDKVTPEEVASASDFAENAKICLSCHEEYKPFLATEMPTKRKEAEFIEETFMNADTRFGEKNCQGCHVKSCTNCHEENKKKPSTDTCIQCHNDLHMGIDYTGLGIREDHQRYRRGPEHGGENYMMMLPDIHFEKGLECADCHSMKSFMDKSLIKQCTDCHSYSKKVLDHEIAGHSNVACVSCHAAWAPTEYGAFYIRFTESDTVKRYFTGIKELNEEYMKSSFMRLNTQFALAKDNKGRYVPIRPRIIFYTANYNNQFIGGENVMLSDRWETFTPHTVRRETVLCESCHTDRRRYLLELDRDRYFMLRMDGLPIDSFLNSESFTLRGGKFVTEKEFAELSKRSPLYVKYYFKKLEQLKKVVR